VRLRIALEALDAEVTHKTLLEPAQTFVTIPQESSLDEF
jgi:hypothetical protein